MTTKKLKTKAWPDGREWPDELNLDVGSNMPMDVYGIHPRHFGVLYIRHDVATKAASELSALQKENAELKKWKEEDPRMLREQIRVADVAFNALQERYNSLRTQNRELREACVQFIAWYHVDPFKGDKHWKELPDIIRQAEQALALQPEK